MEEITRALEKRTEVIERPAGLPLEDFTASRVMASCGSIHPKILKIQYFIVKNGTIFESDQKIRVRMNQMKSIFFLVHRRSKTRTALRNAKAHPR